jgi:hypothetical protein
VYCDEGRQKWCNWRLRDDEAVTFRCTEQAGEGEPTGADSEATVQEQLNRRDEEFGVGVEQEEGAVAAGFEPDGIAWRIV